MQKIICLGGWWLDFVFPENIVNLLIVFLRLFGKGACSPMMMREKKSWGRWGRWGGVIPILYRESQSAAVGQSC